MCCLVAQLPVELLEHIFLYACIPGLTVSSTTWDPSTLHLAQTCVHWREIVFSRPELWSVISLDLAKDSRDVVALVRSYLANSSKTQLVVDLMASDVDDDGRKRLYAEKIPAVGLEVLQILLAESHRWSEASISLHWRLLTALAGLFRHNSENAPDESEVHFPMMENLKLDWDGYYHSPANLFFEACRIAPKLRSFTLWDFHETYPFPYAQLTSISLPSVWMNEDVVRVLRVCPQLKHMDMGYKGGFTSGNLQEIHASSLTSLSLNIQKPTGLAQLFDSLVLPGLTSCTVVTALYAARHIFKDSHQAFVNMLRRSKCSLSELVLDRFVASDDQLWNILRVTPALSRLTVHNATERTVRGFDLAYRSRSEVALRADTSSLLPKLTDLCLTQAHSFTGDNALDKILFS